MIQGLSIDAPHERLAEALGDTDARGAIEAQLPPYLQQHRWFGGASRNLTEAVIQRWVPVEADGVSACLCVASVTDSTGLETEHQLWLALEVASDVGSDLGVRPIVDALSLDGVRAEFLRLSLSGETREGHRARLVCNPTAPAAARCDGPSRLLGVEQSNSSIAYGDACILKVYRRLEQGPNPEVELSRYLTTEGGFTATPQVYATARLEGPDGYGADALMVQAFVPNEGDGWEWALGAARKALAAVEDPDAPHGTDDMHRWLKMEQQTIAAAESLGRTTAQMHAAFARATGEDLQPQPVGREDFDLWNRMLQQEADATAALQTEAFERAEFKFVTQDGPAGWVKKITTVYVPDAGLKTRVHGDYHLGQVLRSESDFVVVDFEGEPARSLDERRSRQHPLVDVAGMLRSWNYAALTASQEFDSSNADETWTWSHAEMWGEIVRGYFLEAYWIEADAALPRFLPPDKKSLRTLLTFFELRKALYEVRYELNNRPDWAWIPEAAVKRFAGDWDRWD